MEDGRERKPSYGLSKKWVFILNNLFEKNWINLVKLSNEMKLFFVTQKENDSIYLFYLKQEVGV